MRLLNVFRAEAVVVARCLAGSGAVRGAFIVVEAALPRCRYRLLSGLSLIDSRVGSHVEDDDAAEERAWPLSTMVAVMADTDEEEDCFRRLRLQLLLVGENEDETARPVWGLGVCAPASNRSFLAEFSVFMTDIFRLKNWFSALGRMKTNVQCATHNATGCSLRQQRIYD
jgi:hypothetical protein